MEVTVNALGQGVTLNTEDASIGNNIEVSKLNELPVQSRLNPTVLFTLQPGITLDGAATGGRVDQDNVTVDGLDVNDFATGNFGSITTNAPVDSVQEFRGTTGGFTPNSGPGGGGQFQLVTRSGTNNWHGQANIYHRDNSTTANDWFNDLVGIGAPKLVQNQFGGSRGRPHQARQDVLLLRLHELTHRSRFGGLRTVPLPSFLAGNISYINNNAGCDFPAARTPRPAASASSLRRRFRRWIPPASVRARRSSTCSQPTIPAANDLTNGDGVNTGGFRFNAPAPDIHDRLRRQARLQPDQLDSPLWRRAVSPAKTRSTPQLSFPADPAAVEFVDRSYRYVVGMDWQLTANKTNQITYGSVVRTGAFPAPSNVLGMNQTHFRHRHHHAAGSIPSPAPSTRSPVTFPSRRSRTTSVGPGPALASARRHLQVDPYQREHCPRLQLATTSVWAARSRDWTHRFVRQTCFPQLYRAVTYDSAFAAALGRVGSIATTTNYDTSGNPLPPPRAPSATTATTRHRSTSSTTGRSLLP